MRAIGTRLLTVVALSTLGCGGSTEPADPTVPASIVLASDTVTTFPGATWRVEVPAATVYNSSHQVLLHGVTWTSADPAVASIVNGERFIQGNEEGTTTVTATAGSATASLTVHVAHENVSSVLIEHEKPAYMYGLDSLLLSAEAYGPQLDGLPDRTITFTSHQPEIASVTPAGFVHVVSSGTARIVATSEGVTDSITVIADARRVARITFDPPSATLVVGENRDWSIHMYDASDTDLGNRPRSWTSSDTTVAIAGYTSVQAIKVGTAVITLTSDTVTKHIPVTVVAAP